MPKQKPPWAGTPTRNLRLHDPVVNEVFKLKSLMQVALGRPISFDEMIADMTATFQNLYVKEGKIVMDSFNSRKR